MESTEAVRPSPSRSWFAASRVNDRVDALEQKMDLVHRYCFATCPRDIQQLRMANDNHISRIDGIDKRMTKKFAEFQLHWASLHDVQTEHENLLRQNTDRGPAPLPAESPPERESAQTHVACRAHSKGSSR